MPHCISKPIHTMRKTSIFFSICFIISQMAFSQSSLESLLLQINENIQQVQTGDATTDQSLDFDKEQAWKITFNSTLNPKKGDPKQTAYHLNLSDIDKNTVRYNTKKDLIFVQLYTKRQQAFIKTYKDGELQNYSSQLQIKATDVDNAKLLVDLIKQSLDIEVSQQYPEFNNYNEAMDWLQEQITTVEIGQDQLEQTWKTDADNPLVCELSTLERSKKEPQTHRQLFNLADFGKHTISLEVKGKLLFIRAKVRRSEKLIEHWIEAKKDKYESEIDIHMNDIDVARSVLYVLEYLIGQAEEQLANNTLDELSLNQILTELSTSIQTVEFSKSTVEQSASASCLVQLNRTKTSEKDPELSSSVFHLGDIKPNAVDISISGDKIAVKLKTASNEKLIQMSKEGIAQSYTNNTSIWATDVENLRYLRQLLPIAIKGCSEELAAQTTVLEQNSEPATLVPLILEMIGDKTSDKNSLTQELTPLDNNCKWSFNSIITGGKSPTKELWEFNNSDLDLKSLSFSISKTDVFVEVATKHKEKIIKYYKNDEPDNYRESLKIWVKDIEQGRRLMTLWAQLIQACDDK